MLRFVHIADVHLGVSPDAQMPWGEKRKEDIRKSFYKVLHIVREEKIPLLLIAGDLFHGQPLKRELKELDACFSQMPKTQIVCVAGNHDYVHPGSYYRSFVWSENVYFLWRNEMQKIYLPEPGVTVYGSSYWTSKEPEDVYSNLRPDGRAGYHILLLHGGDAQHRPFSVEKLKKSGFDYIACGHIHQAGNIVPGKIVMAGALEPTDRNDFGPHGYWVGELDGGVGRTSFYPIQNCQYGKREIAVSSEMSARDVARQVTELLAERPGYEISHLVFTGYRDPEVVLPMELFRQQERVVSVTDDTRPAYDFERLKMQYADGLIGKFIRQMEQYPDQGIAQQALYYGLDAIYQSQEEV